MNANSRIEGALATFTVYRRAGGGATKSGGLGWEATQQREFWRDYRVVGIGLLVTVRIV